MRIPLISLIFQGIPEYIALFTLGYALLKIPPEWKRIVPMGVLLGVTTYFVRMLPISPGVHTLILIFVFSILLRVTTGIPFSRIFIAGLIGALLLALAEFCFTGMMFSLLHADYEDLVNRPVLWTLLGLPQVVFLFAIAWLIRRRNRGISRGRGDLS